MIRKSVWLVNYTGRKGGGPLDAICMTKGLLHCGIPVVAVVSKDVENLEQWKRLSLEKLIVIETYHSKVDFLLKTMLFALRQKRELQAAMRGYDVEVSYSPMFTFWTGWINKAVSCRKKIGVVHDPLARFGDKQLLLRFFHYVALDMDVLLVHSRRFVDIVAKEYRKPTYYIPLGRHNIYAECPNKEHAICYDATKVNFLFFGTISKYKGLNVLAEAYRALSADYGDRVTLTIAGAGDFSPYRASFEGLPGITVINRWIRNEETESFFMGDNMIVVCPYLGATQSGVVLLTYEYQIPIIATDTGALSEQVEDEVTGLLIPPGDATALKTAMERLAGDEKLRERMASEQRKLLKELDWNVSAEKLIEIARE